jgi:hypothetical protein
VQGPITFKCYNHDWLYSFSKHHLQLADAAAAAAEGIVLCWAPTTIVQCCPVTSQSKTTSPFTPWKVDW